PQRDAPAASGGFGQANLVIISLDTLRADGTTFGGGPADVSPALDAFARESTVFEHARAQAPHTAPSHMTLFTAALPSVHEVQNVSFKQNADGGRAAVILPAREDVPTLAEVLKATGFRTVGLTDGGNLNPPHGFARGFDTYTYDLEGVEDKVALGLQEVQRLAAQDSGRFFLFWHTYQVHAPYCPPQEYVERWAPDDYAGALRERIESLGGLSFQERWGRMKSEFWRDRETFGEPEAAFLRGVYHGGIRYTDDHVARLLAGLRDQGVLDDSIVVLLSDHGEEFFEHGQWQHEQLYEECLRVPLVVRLPGGRGAGQRIRTPVGLIDVMPTVLDLLEVRPEGLSLPGKVRHGGRSLADAVLTGREPRPRAIVSELIDDRVPGGNFERLVAIHANGMKFVQDKVRGVPGPDGKGLRHPDKTPILKSYLFDLAVDPSERNNLIDQSRPQLGPFKELLEAYETMVKLEQAGGIERQATPLTPEMLEQLEQLGYVEGAADDGDASR
ncbi:MAG: sulfatase, partial [Planctomycetes bacterium]|nr:sulfatase [Planctomycetota bacterium]